MDPEVFELLKEINELRLLTRKQAQLNSDLIHQNCKLIERNLALGDFPADWSEDLKAYITSFS